MSNTFALDDIRAAAERQYADTTIQISDTQSVKLLNPLRLPEARRNKLIAIQDRMNAAAKGDSDENQGDLLEEGLRLVAERGAEILIDAIGGDLTVLASTFQHYTKETQAGEA
jgi:hypothetical protein